MILSQARMCVLDVFEHEPNIDAELLKACSIVTRISPGYTLEGKLRVHSLFYNALCKYLQVAPTVDFHFDASWSAAVSRSA